MFKNGMVHYKDVILLIKPFAFLTFSRCRPRRRIFETRTFSDFNAYRDAYRNPGS